MSEKGTKGRRRSDQFSQSPSAITPPLFPSPLFPSSLLPISTNFSFTRFPPLDCSSPLLFPPFAAPMDSPFSGQLIASFGDLLSPSSFWSDFDRRSPAAAVLSEAAVLVLLRPGEKDGQWSMLLTQRSHQMRTHPGEVCLPGGMRDPGDGSPADTALREALEEIGLPSSRVRLLGQLPPMVTRRRVAVHPVLALLQGESQFTPMCSPAEVQCSFWAPLDQFLLARAHRLVRVPDSDFSTHLFLLDDQNPPVFGLTGAICLAVAIGLLQRLPEFNLELGDEMGREEDSPRYAVRSLFRHFGKLRRESLSPAQISKAVVLELAKM